MNPEIRAQIRNYVAEVEETNRRVLMHMRDRLRAYERENGEVEPLAAGSRLPRKPTDAQGFAMFKRELIRLGEYAPPAEDVNYERTPDGNRTVE